MNFLVIWMRRALDQLTSFWLKSDSQVRNAITKAAYQIDHELKTNPELVGQRTLILRRDTA